MSPNNRKRLVLKWFRRGVLMLIAAGALAAVIVALLPKPVRVSLVVAKLGPMKVTIDEDGVTRVKDRYVVSAPLSGQLARISLYPGDSIVEGQVLARLMPLQPQLLNERARMEAEARLTAAVAAQQQSVAMVSMSKAALDLAKSDLDRQQALWREKATTKRELEAATYGVQARTDELASAEFGVKVARQNAVIARAALGRLGRGAKDSGEEMVVTSPVNGQVLRVVQRSESATQAGAPILEVGDPRALEIVADVLTRDAVNIKPGARVIVERWGGQPLGARVNRVEPSAFTRISALGIEEQRVNVVIDIDAPPEAWSALGDGYRVEVQVETWATDQTIQVPASAVFRHGDGWALYVDNDGRAELRTVETGHRNRTHVEITKGVDAETRLVLHPSDQVRDGTKIEGA